MFGMAICHASLVPNWVESKVSLWKQTADSEKKWKRKVGMRMFFVLEVGAQALLSIFISNLDTPSPFTLKHSCKHLLLSPLCICAGKYFPFLFICVRTRPPLAVFTSTQFVSSSVATRHMKSLWRWKADSVTLWVGKAHCKSKQVRNVRFGKQKLHSSRWSQTPFSKRGLQLNAATIV